MCPSVPLQESGPFLLCCCSLMVREGETDICHRTKESDVLEAQLATLLTDQDGALDALSLYCGWMVRYADLRMSAKMVRVKVGVACARLDSTFGDVEGASCDGDVRWDAGAMGIG